MLYILPIILASSDCSAMNICTQHFPYKQVVGSSHAVPPTSLSPVTPAVVHSSTVTGGNPVTSACSGQASNVQLPLPAGSGPNLTSAESDGSTTRQCSSEHNPPSVKVYQQPQLLDVALR